MRRLVRIISLYPAVMQQPAAKHGARHGAAADILNGQTTDGWADQAPAHATNIITTHLRPPTANNGSLALRPPSLNPI